ncbi:MAG: hypothetical protein QM705_05725 [Ancrocorticia sp.]
MKMKKISTLLMVPALAVSLAACGGSSKPSKTDVEAGYQELFELSGGGELSAEDKEQTDILAACIADKTHETMSAEGLLLVTKGDFENQEEAMTEEDQKALEEAMMTCLQEAFPELSGGDK